MLTIIPKNKLPEEKYLRIADPAHVRDTLAHTAAMRAISRECGGKSKDGNWRMNSAIPASIYWGKLEQEYLKRCKTQGLKPDAVTQANFRRVDNELRLTFHNPDKVERERRSRAFCEEYSKFKTR